MKSPEDRKFADPYVTRSSLFLRLKATDRNPREMAWQEFRDKYAQVIAGFARNLGAQSQDVEDVIQDVMLGFFARSPSFVYDPEKGRFRGYLKVCTIHALKRRLGQNAKFQGIPLQDVDPESLEVSASWDDHWEQQRLKRAIEAVRARYGGNKTFEAFERQIILGEPVDSVCKTLGMTAASVYQAKTRITAALRQHIREMEKEEE